MSSHESLFANNRIVITGAASGLGRAVALRYAKEGWAICIADINMIRAEDVAKEVEASGGTAMIAKCNVSNDSDFEALRDRLEAEWGGLDVLINNAGISSAGSLEQSSYDEWQRLLDINLMGVVRSSKTFAPLIAKQGHGGHIVNVSSFAGIASAPGMMTYNVAKAGVIAFSESLRHELACANIGVSVVCPAFFETNLLESMNREEAVKMVTHLMKTSGVTAEDVADHIFRGVKNKEFMLITHKDAKWQYVLKRLSPELFYSVMRKAFSRKIKKVSCQAIVEPRMPILFSKNMLIWNTEGYMKPWVHPEFRRILEES